MERRGFKVKKKKKKRVKVFGIFVSSLLSIFSPKTCGINRASIRHQVGLLAFRDLAIS